MTARLRVATQNVFGAYTDWPARREALRKSFETLDPDFATFQEAIAGEATDQAAEILGAGYHFARQTEREDDGRGLATASRWPIRSVHEVDLDVTPRTADFACGALVVEVDTPLGDVLLVNYCPNHQPAYERERELQAVALARYLESRVDAVDHVLILGDFDADPVAASVRFLTGRQSLADLSVCYRDAWDSAHPGEPGGTFVPENPIVADWDWPSRRIDYILVRCLEHGGPSLAIDSCERLHDQPVDGVWASDHFGLTADLVAPPR
ncbi:endonuclease/exonuclease/phosphatase family protein [Asanoa sp. WMMD1127]|uniref:endonuclease/exonuclease/phosphatase family protein n=1 Tax=Asanoa sp. WMMD1127 TaxID=3016107 RepID=UPI0024173C0B|nr:endonuclease/exonuclease/phosphatase family protein [Asanoa sp. WMMD1127]MDG4826462.1 endonuclease/exonuclease/phosphatase family protein [Asanoa sp. WMMD1127]